MSFFYIDPIKCLNKSYQEFLEDVSRLKHDEFYINEVDTYKFLTILTFKIITNQNFCILDSDFSEFEMQSIKSLNKNTISLVENLDLKSYEELINLVKSSTSEISIFTSGTTGRPKQIVHTILSLTRTVKLSAKNDSVIWAYAYNPTHIAGLQVFFQALFNKNALVDTFKKTKSVILTSIKEYGITHISATPTFYRLLLPNDEVFKNVRRVSFGGEKSDTDLYNKVKLLFPNAKVTNIYASTELGTLLHANGEDFHIPKSLESDVLIKDNELYVSSKFLGKSEELQVLDGFYRTGDIVEVLSNNPTVFRFVSRNSDYINVGGYKVNKQEVESVINMIEGVNLVRVLVKTSSILGNMLIAEVVPTSEDDKISEKYIKDILKVKLQEFKIPRIIKIVKEIDFTRSGKLSKK